VTSRTTPGLAADVGRLLRGARTTIGWTQDQLSERAGVPQSAVSRVERGLHAGLDLDDLERIASAMGGTVHVELRAPFLADRGRQRDRVHARCVAYVVARLRRAGWMAESEVEIRGSAGPGWIDVLAYHPTSRVMLVIEVKTEIHDFGRIQRTLGWYEHAAWAATRGFGWLPRRGSAALVLLDTRAVADRLRNNRLLAAQAFPERAEGLARLIEAPAVAPVDSGRFLAVVDPLSRRATWVRATMLDRRRTPPRYADYADIARRLTA
jgi:transcriptional regulator with XRE-family HTH domain